jgi:hypothetical protein
MFLKRLDAMQEHAVSAKECMAASLLPRLQVAYAYSKQANLFALLVIR